MPSVAAQLELEAVVGSGQPQPLRVQVFVPEKAEVDWTCAVTFSGFINESRWLPGIDSWQALKLGLAFARTNLELCRAQLLHFGEPVLVSELFAKAPAA